jgi:hypothetical protein
VDEALESEGNFPVGWVIEAKIQPGSEALMATNPKLSSPDNPPHRSSVHHGHAKVRLMREHKFSWPMMALIAAGALLIAMIAVMPRATHIAAPPSGAEVPQQPTPDQVELTHIKLTPAPAGDALYLTAVLHNAGDTAITGVQLQAEFLGRNGPVLQTTTRPMEGLVVGSRSQDLTQSPIKPNESRPVRVYFEHTPKGWNHRLPQLTVMSVTGTTPQ